MANSTADPILDSKLVELSYDIAGCSSVSGSYEPKNLLYNRPSDPNSRWSGHNHAGKATKQWVLLKLKSPSIVRTITFGKYHTSHPCNVKDVVVFGGPTTDSMVELLRTTLRNDPVYEKFSLSSGKPFLCNYIRVSPITGYNPSYNHSLWYLALHGNPDGPFLDWHSSEMMATRLVLKYLRQKGLREAFDSVSLNTGVQLEHPLATSLFDNLVLHSNWDESEALIDQIHEKGLFNTHLNTLPPILHQIRLCSFDSDKNLPCGRGGHDTCIEPSSGDLYLLGGWTGERMLADFWTYSATSRCWQLLSNDTASTGGPGLICNHKMTVDPRNGDIYVLGAPQTTTTESTSSQTYPVMKLFKYSSKKGWSCLHQDTKAIGGPDALIDHQMVMDELTDSLYVFGGMNSRTRQYSGMYRYEIASEKWSILFLDYGSPFGQEGGPAIPSRSGHAMVRDKLRRRLYIIAGKRKDKYLADMWSFDLDTHAIEKIRSKVPDPVFSMRVVLDETSQMLVSVGGLFCDKQANRENVKSSIRTFSFSTCHWSTPMKSTSRHGHPTDAMSPRYAHSLSIKPSGTFYVFGGNEIPHDETRLSSFYEMQLKRVPAEAFIRNIKFRIRQQRFAEMCKSAPAVDCLSFLQTSVSEMVNHDDAKESTIFRSLVEHIRRQLVSGTSQDSREESSPSLESRSRKERMALFESLMEMFPADARAPHNDLMDLAQLTLAQTS